MTDTEPRATTLLSSPIPTPPPANGTVTGLVSGILDDAQTLVRQQIEMLKAEVREDFKRSKQAAEFGGLGIVMLTVGMLGLVTALAYVLHEDYQFSMWASWGITGMLFTVLGGACATTSYLMLERFNPLPDKTFNALQENISWKTSTNS
ncbi:MAG: phage holin family protein [Planctomycetes bacterium]|nr:phage holin family protein [Planctomycetota bacterium]